MQWPKIQFSWQIYLIAGILIFGSLTALNIASFDNARLSIKQAMRHDTSWNGANGRIEVEKLKSALSSYLLLQDDAGKTRVDLQIAIVKSRLGTWSQGSFGEFVNEDTDRIERLAQAKQVLVDIEDLISEHTAIAERKELMEKSNQLSRIFHDLGSLSHQTSMNRAAAAREELQHQQQIQRRISEFLMGLGALLLFVAIRQNVSLKSASDLAVANAHKFAHLAKHDPVTGLPNRTAVDEKLTALASAQQKPQRVCVLAADLDGFKRINDMLGHIVGDAALKAVGQHLIKAVEMSGAAGMVARVGGDEFLIILENCDQDWSLPDFARSLLQSLDVPMETEAGKVSLGLSIGYAESNYQQQAFVHLIMDADLALTEAKLRGKRRAVAYNNALRTKMKRREAVEDALPSVARNHEIRPVFQPFFDIQTGRCVGFEALARWAHPELGQIAPDEFISIAETTGDIVDIGGHILLLACREAVSWESDAAISVNLSMSQILRSDIVRDVRKVLDETGLDPHRLKLEITESVLISDLDRTVAVLRQFQNMGIRVSLDDFGTGYSGLSYLAKFAWDEIKIDRSFVISAGSSEDVRNVVKMVVKIAAQLGAVVTIEGIETHEQREQFASFGCHTAQGFLFGKPQGRDKISGYLQRQIVPLGRPANPLRA
ncbi:putative bifunctional diguanylate cyclase/phosphodiesterase [Roseibium sp.]|uniref:putative bifunctional diguanylate cyclase/phosphodiesterase n=1 Tax=Roseibium sp. TaxID=1936156 RepID=UPI003B52119C